MINRTRANPNKNKENTQRATLTNEYVKTACVYVCVWDVSVDRWIGGGEHVESDLKTVTYALTTKVELNGRSLCATLIQQKTQHTYTCKHAASHCARARTRAHQRLTSRCAEIVSVPRSRALAFVAHAATIDVKMPYVCWVSWTTLRSSCGSDAGLIAESLLKSDAEVVVSIGLVPVCTIF